MYVMMPYRVLYCYLCYFSKESFGRVQSKSEGKSTKTHRKYTCGFHEGSIPSSRTAFDCCAGSMGPLTPPPTFAVSPPGREIGCCAPAQSLQPHHLSVGESFTRQKTLKKVRFTTLFYNTPGPKQSNRGFDSLISSAETVKSFLAKKENLARFHVQTKEIHL